MWYQILGLLGALAILGAYFGYQKGWMNNRSWEYNALNLVGALLLTWVSIQARSYGLVAMNLIWIHLSVRPLLQTLRSTGFARTLTDP